MGMSGRVDDAALFEAWRAGDRAAGDELTARHYPRVLRFFCLKAQSIAEDLTQRTFLACLQSAVRVRNARAFRPFLFGIARRQLSMALRDRAYEDAFSARHVDSVPTQLSRLAARRQEQQLVLRALAALPADAQMTLSLYYWEDMRTRDLGTVFGISSSAARSRLASARAQLRETVTGLLAPARTKTSLLADLDAWSRSLVAPDRAT